MNLNAYNHDNLIKSNIECNELLYIKRPMKIFCHLEMLNYRICV